MIDDIITKTEVGALTREDALYFEKLLRFGYLDEYEEWMNSCLQSEDPLIDIVLELSVCASDFNKTISVLHNYCASQKADESAVCDRLRLFFKDAYYSNRMTKEEITSVMYSLARDSGYPYDNDCDSWESMYYFHYYLPEAEEGYITMESFDEVFFSYLDDGIPFDTDSIRSKNNITVIHADKPSCFDRIKRFFKR